MTLVTNHPLLDPFNTDDQYISIYLGQEHATLRDSIAFDRIIKTAESTGRPSYDMSTKTHGIRFHFRQSQGITALGAFRIGVEYEGESHYTSTIVLMHNATITPEQTTLTAHLGETVTILFNTDMMTDTLKWRFNGDLIYGSKGKQSLTLENIQMDKAGLYKCFIQSHRWDADQQAIQLLHIIKCPAYRWGADCEQDCPECLNGGRCDADSGECVCPPGFSGTTCDQVLGSNRFGQNGSFSCDTSGDDHSLACRGKLFCLPDPFGCTCAAGFMGIDCTRECARGRYGANCLQECHCGPTNICKKDTGECMDGTTCADDWTGVNCQVRGSPSLDTGDDEVITDIATTSLYAPIADTTLAPIPVTTIDTIPASTTETTQPVPSFEISSFQYSRVNHGNPTTFICVVKASPSPPALESISVTYTVNGQLTIIPRLNSTANETTRTSWYQATVRLDEMPKNFTCLFRGPDEMILASQDLAVYVFEPPNFNEANILVRESTSQSITIRWSAWNGNYDYGDGPVIGYHVYYNTNGQSDLVRASQNIISNTTYHITGLVHDRQYDIRVTALREGEGGEGSYSSPITKRTSCIAPSTAPVLSLRGQTQSSISLSWEVIYDYFIYSYN
ncbi:angiopoietin-1 receptor-like [Lytechinus pictus]|uniref:angiopoietin-1 receptor-like n=1 Tax=Lytechinus pictus TaxID=7653 RepID=UPI0030BA1D8F